MTSQQTKTTERKPIRKPIIPAAPRREQIDLEAEFIVACVRRGHWLATL